MGSRLPIDEEDGVKPLSIKRKSQFNFKVEIIILIYFCQKYPLETDHAVIIFNPFPFSFISTEFNA